MSRRARQRRARRFSYAREAGAHGVAGETPALDDEDESVREFDALSLVG
jgi:hypothetical protein